MLSVNYFEILSKPQYTCTENKYLCVLLDGCVVSGLAPVAAVSFSGIYPDPVPRGHLCGDQHYALSMGFCLQSPNRFQCHVHPQHSTTLMKALFFRCFCYVITIDILVLVDSGSLEHQFDSWKSVGGMGSRENKSCSETLYAHMISN